MILAGDRRPSQMAEGDVEGWVDARTAAQQVHADGVLALLAVELCLSSNPWDYCDYYLKEWKHCAD